MASLIKVSGGKVPSRAIQFVNAAGERKTIRIGKCGLEQARTFKQNVERLLACKTLGAPPDLQLAAWVADLPDDMHEKLAAVDLVSPRQPKAKSLTLKEWTAKYIGQRKGDLKPASIAKLERTVTLLTGYLGESKPIDEIDENEAFDWRAWVRSEKKLGDGTAGTHVRNVKQLFENARKRRLIASNPFAELAGPVVGADRDRYITPTEAETILTACPDVQGKLLFGLARLAGLRVPSETHLLTWTDVDFEKSQLSVFAPKTERFEKHRRRPVPVTPPLMKLLEQAFEAAPEGQKLVISLSRNNLHRIMRGIVRRAGFEPWPRLFQALRQSCDTEWKQTYPAYAVDAWLGHSGRVSEKHYLMIPEELWKKVAEGAAKSAAEGSCTDSQPVAPSDQCQSVAPQGTSDKIGVSSDPDAGNATSGVRTRTGDLGVMNPML